VINNNNKVIKITSNKIIIIIYLNDYKSEYVYKIPGGIKKQSFSANHRSIILCLKDLYYKHLYYKNLY